MLKNAITISSNLLSLHSLYFILQKLLVELYEIRISL